MGKLALVIVSALAACAEPASGRSRVHAQAVGFDAGPDASDADTDPVR